MFGKAHPMYVRLALPEGGAFLDFLPGCSIARLALTSFAIGHSTASIRHNAGAWD
jgi:hypothetical protein